MLINNSNNIDFLVGVPHSNSEPRVKSRFIFMLLEKLDIPKSPQLLYIKNYENLVGNGNCPINSERNNV